MTFLGGVDAWVPTHLISFSNIQTAGVPAESGNVIGLLKPGLSRAAAEAEMRGWPGEGLFDSARDRAVKLVSLRDFQAGEIYPLSLKLWLASIFFLVLTVAAAGSIFQTEAELRREEFALRSALGASARRLLGALTLESATVIIVALAASFLVRSFLVHVTATHLLLPSGFRSGLHGAGAALGMGAAAISLAAALVVHGATLRQYLPLSSVWNALRSEPVQVHRGRHHILRRVPVEIVPATLLAIAAALLIRSAYQTMHIDPNVRAADAFVSEVSLSDSDERFAAGRIKPGMSRAEAERANIESYRLFRESMNSRVSAMVDMLTENSAVVHAGAISTAPYRGHQPLAWDVRFSRAPGSLPGADTVGNVILRSMTPGVVPALGMRLVHGRNFTGRGAEDDNTAVVNQALAEKIAPGPAALGHYVKSISLPPARIVGIVNNVREQSLRSQVWPTVYFPFSEYGLADVDVVVRTVHGVSDRQALHLIETAVHSSSPTAAVSHFEPLRQMVESAGTLARYTAAYLLALALLSVFLAGVSASSKVLGEFHRRKAEVGIRMALGATKGAIVGLFVYSNLARGSTAAMLGALLAWWFTHLLGSLLYDVKLLDPVSYAVGVIALIGSVTIAQVLLLRRALRKNPRDLF